MLCCPLRLYFSSATFSTYPRGFLQVSLMRGGELLPAFGPLLAFGHHALSHANTRAAGAPHALLHAHRVKTARTSPRARKHAQRHFRAVPCASALCWRPMAGPRRPHQPRASRTTRPRRTTTHADARAAVHLSLQSAPIAQAPAPSSGTIPHRSATRPARRFTARRARRHAARAGHRARATLPEQGCCAVCMQTAQQPCLF